MRKGNNIFIGLFGGLFTGIGLDIILYSLNDLGVLVDEIVSDTLTLNDLMAYVVILCTLVGLIIGIVRSN